MIERVVLCVDDDAAVREFYEIAFLSRGHCAVTAESGTQAMTILSQHCEDIDAVLVDYEMPGINGLELAAEIKRQQPNLPVIMVSGNDEIAGCTPNCVDRFLMKGSDLELLFSQIEQLSHASRAQKPLEKVRWTAASSIAS